MKYEKIIKWILALLFVVGVIVSAYGFIAGWPGKEQIADPSTHLPVNIILACAYAFVGITLLAVAFGVFVIGGINSPRSLVKMLLGLVVIAALVGGAWALAPGTPAIGAVLDKAPTDFQLKLTDATLILTYLLCGASVISILAGPIISAIRK